MRNAFLVALLLVAGPVSAADMRLDRVVLSTGGVGYFDHTASVGGAGADLALPLPLGGVDDFLKSVVIDDPAGLVRGITMPGPASSSDPLRALGLQPEALASQPALLQALRGSQIRVIGPRPMNGRLVAVEPVQAAEAGVAVQRWRLTLLTQDGLRGLALDQADTIQLTDAGLDAALQQALLQLGRRGPSETVAATIRLADGARRDIRLGYLAETPLWKATYRLDLAGETGQARGWAVLENAGDRDWTDVSLTLVAGSPQTFRQELYRSYLVPRPLLPVMADEAASPAPPSLPRLRTAKSAPDRAPVAAMIAAMADEAAPPPAEATEQLAETVFRLPGKVTVPAGQTLTLPLIDKALPAVAVSLWRGLGTGHPQAAVRLTNDDAASLPPGIVTLYGGAAGERMFLGDAPMPPLPAHETRVLTYALDRKMEVAGAIDQMTRLVRLKALDGVLELATTDILTHGYEVTGAADEPRRLGIEEPALPGWNLVEPVGLSLQGGVYRLEATLPPGGKAAVKAVFERPETRRIELREEAPDLLLTALDGYELSETQRQSVAGLRARNAAVTDARADVERALGERAAIVTEQERLRANLQTVPAESDLARRYLAKLAEQEARLDVLAAEEIAGQARVKAAEAARLDFLRQLTL